MKVVNIGQGDVALFLLVQLLNIQGILIARNSFTLLPRHDISWLASLLLQQKHSEAAPEQVVSIVFVRGVHTSQVSGYHSHQPVPCLVNHF